jgi:integrative and conjugative element protein (TIGR02256 family)
VKSVIKGVKFSQQALEIFTSEIKKYGTIETGGVLMGAISEETLSVHKASDGGPNAVHEGIFFQADANYIDMFIDMEYANTNGSTAYLGEWHTHPQVIPYPSPRDLISLEEIADTSDEFAILLIIGAVDFSKDKFSRQSIVLLKYRDTERFFELPVFECK